MKFLNASSAFSQCIAFGTFQLKLRMSQGSRVQWNLIWDFICAHKWEKNSNTNIDNNQLFCMSQIKMIKLVKHCCLQSSNAMMILSMSTQLHAVLDSGSPGTDLMSSVIVLLEPACNSVRTASCSRALAPLASLVCWIPFDDFCLFQIRWEVWEVSTNEISFWFVAFVSAKHCCSSRAVRLRVLFLLLRLAWMHSVHIAPVHDFPFQSPLHNSKTCTSFSCPFGEKGRKVTKATQMGRAHWLTDLSVLREIQFISTGKFHCLSTSSGNPFLLYYSELRIEFFDEKQCNICRGSVPVPHQQLGPSKVVEELKMHTGKFLDW